MELKSACYLFALQIKLKRIYVCTNSNPNYTICCCILCLRNYWNKTLKIYIFELEWHIKIISTVFSNFEIIKLYLVLFLLRFLLLFLWCFLFWKHMKHNNTLLKFILKQNVMTCKKLFLTMFFENIKSYLVLFLWHFLFWKHSLCFLFCLKHHNTLFFKIIYN